MAQGLRLLPGNGLVGLGLDLRGIGLYCWKIIDGTGEGGGVRGLRWIYEPITRMPTVAGLISMVI